MFLDVLRRRNPALIEQAIAFHQAGQIPANSYVIDLDAVAENASIIKAAADRAGLKIFAMTKQMGRNGDFCRSVLAGGITHAVAVDMECARACVRAGLSLGHLGHLVQVPRAEAAAGAAMRPDYWTVFNREKAAEAAAANQAAGREQALLARLFAPGDRFYNGHEGGFPAETVVDVANALDALPGARFAGITTFPALLFSPELGDADTTHNLGTLARAVEALAKSGRRDIEVNAPGTNSAIFLQRLADHGATQCEPGHGLTGTTPLHALHDLPERPAVAYLSEVSHIHAGRAYCFGGGLYVDPVFPDYAMNVVVAREPASGPETLHGVEIPPPSAIDYYGMIDVEGPRAPQIGDSVVFGFRPQAFVTRAYVVGIAGLSSGNPSVGTIHDAFGRPIDWPG
ncbi:alanine racemase [Acidisoma cellulosilytica]|uniref:Alanine racemase n=1 Tax=Acidisoma cellulosilyticum TaxID=2802395 RepID=A0A963Z2P9_9PROT|nr:alanine racemase [Acidisoma cellulosilyticum]MCB8881439.1 alanine racemase [Acidisoma cellulosilyticum]